MISVGLVLLAGTGHARAAEVESHILATKDIVAVPGYKLTTESTTHMKDGKCTFITEGEDAAEGTYNSSSTEIVTLEILSSTRFRRTLTKLEEKSRIEAMAEVVDAPGEAALLIGVPVILEKHDNGSYTAKLENREATSEENEKLEEIAREAAFRDDFHMYGDQPRKPGDKWEVDATKLSGFANATKLKGSLSVEFVEVKEIAGVRCAVLKNTIDLSYITDDEETGEVSTTLKVHEVLHRSLGELVNLDSKAEGETTIATVNEDMTTRMTAPILITILTSVVKP